MMTLSWSRCCVNLWVCPLCDDVIRIIFSTDVFTRFVASTLHRDFISYLDRTVTELHKRDVIHRRALSVSRHQRAPSLDGSRALSPIATAGAIEMVQLPTYCSHMNTVVLCPRYLICQVDTSDKAVASKVCYPLFHVLPALLRTI